MDRLRSIWTWVPSLYFTSGIPYVIVMTIAAILFKRLGMDNAECAFFTSWLFLPWIIQPLWTQGWRHYGRWVVGSQIIIGIALGCMALAIKAPYNISWILVALWIVAFTSMTHDFAADKYYGEMLDAEEQGLFLGVRSKAYYLALIVGQGLTLMVAGGLETYYRNIEEAWFTTVSGIALLVLLLGIYHVLVFAHSAKKYRVQSTEYREVESRESRVESSGEAKEGADVKDLRDLKDLRERPEKIQGLKVDIDSLAGRWMSAIVILLFVIPKALTGKVNLFFLLDPISQGGLGLSLTEIGFAQGTIGIIGLSVGIIMSNNLIARDGLKRWLWVFLLAFTLPQLFYVYISWMHVSHFGLICAFIFIEQLGYGLGLTALLYYIHLLSQDESRKYGVCTALMAVGMLVPGLFSGDLQMAMGYSTFYVFAASTGIITLTVGIVMWKQVVFCPEGKKRTEYKVQSTE